jgi:hypothetical protein
MCLIQDVGFDCALCGSPETFLNAKEEVIVCGGCDSVVPQWMVVPPTP